MQETDQKRMPLTGATNILHVADLEGSSLGRKLAHLCIRNALDKGAVSRIPVSQLSLSVQRRILVSVARPGVSFIPVKSVMVASKETSRSVSSRRRSSPVSRPVIRA